MKAITLEAFLDAKKPEDLVKTLSFEDGLTLLESLVDKVESGILDLEKGISAYERALVLNKHLRSLISGAEAKLELLKMDTESGKKD